MPGAVAGTVTQLEPVTATVLATVVLGERLPLGALTGGVLVLAAVAGLYLRRPAGAEHEAVAEPHG